MFFSLSLGIVASRLSIRIATIALCLIGCLMHHDARALEAGAAKVEITPPLGTPLHGYGDRMARPATSVHDPLWSRALFLDDGENRVMLVNTDLCLINPELRARVLELAPPEIPREQIILTATHTHNAQGAMHRHLPFRFVAGRFMPEVLEQTARGIVQSMQEALNSRQRAALGYGSIQQNDLSANRRDPEGPIDPQIGILRVDDADGNPIAILCNFTAHPTSVPKEDRFAISADYVGFYYNALEEAWKSATPPEDPAEAAPEAAAAAPTGHDPIAFFLNGAEGNQTIAGAPGAEGPWGRTEAVGQALAERVYEAARNIDSGEATLRVAYAEAKLPPTLADQLVPAQTILHTLEINEELLLCFFPGEPLVELGLALREQALAAGYTAQWSVGLANDYVLYFVPKAFYHHSSYEAGQNYYGPRIAEWFYGQFAEMMTKPSGYVPADRADFPPAPVQDLLGGQQVVLSGGPWERGFRRGRLFHEELRALFEARVAEPVSENRYIPPTGILAYIPPFIDPRPIALPMFAIGARTMLDGVSEDAFVSIEGMAEGAGLPFDALWLLQNAHHAALRGDRGPLFTSPLCTMMGLDAARSADGIPRIGRNLDWAGDDTPVLLEVRPDNGRAYVHIGFPWNEGVFSGMNEAGLVLCVESQPEAGYSETTGPPIEIILRETLQQYSSYEDAIEVLRNASHIRGVHVMVAGMGEEGLQMAVVEYGDSVRVRTLGEEESLILGATPAAPYLSEACRQRYSRVTELAGDQPLAVEQLLGILSDYQPTVEAQASIRNEATRHIVVFEPTRRQVLVAFPGPLDETPQFEAMTLARSATP